jgi:hypothetical protein
MKVKIGITILCGISILIAGFLTEKWLKKGCLTKDESEKTISTDISPISPYQDENENTNTASDSLDPISVNKSSNENIVQTSNPYTQTVSPCEDKNINTGLNDDSVAASNNRTEIIVPDETVPITDNREETIAPVFNYGLTPSTSSIKDTKIMTSTSSTSNPLSSLDTKACASLDTASILANIEKRIDIILNNPLELKYIQIFDQIQNMKLSINDHLEVICICSQNNYDSKDTLSVYELFTLFKRYPLVPCWVFSDIDLMIDTSKPSLGDCMQKYNLDLTLKMLVMDDLSVKLIQTLLCEERISKHIEILEIYQCFTKLDDDLEIVLPLMENLKTLMIKNISTDLLINLIANSYKTFMNLDILIVETWLDIPPNYMHDFTYVFLTVLNTVQKEVFLRWSLLQNLLFYLTTNETSSNLNIQAQKLTLDLSSYLAFQLIEMPDSDYLYYYLQESTKILFKQNTTKYVFITSELFLNHQNIPIKQFEDLIVDSYNTVKDKRRNSNIRVDYMDFIKGKTITILSVESNP